VSRSIPPLRAYIVCISGIGDINIGETACSPDCIEPMPFIKIDEPTISMNFLKKLSGRKPGTRTPTGPGLKEK